MSSEVERITIGTKIRAVKKYQTAGTLEQVAALYHVHRNTLWRWKRQYEKGELNRLKKDRFFNRHWKRLPRHLEDTIVALKESNPSVTVREAQRVLRKKGYAVSLKGVWNTWNRYGLTGFARIQLSPGYNEYLESAVPRGILRTIKSFIKKKKLKEAARIINTLPDFPHNEIILQIPQHMLSLRKQVNRIRAEFGKIPLSRFALKAKKLRKMLEKHSMRYSSLWVAVAECYTLMWSGQPKEVLKIVRVLKKRIQGIRDPRLRFITLLIEGQACASILRIKRAKACADECKQIVRHSKNPYFFMGGLGGIYSIMGYFREALFWTRKALHGAAPSYRQQLYVNLAGFLTASGDYRAALSALKKGKLEEWGFRSRASIIRAFAYLDQGDFQRASVRAIETVTELKKEGVKRFLHPATLILACCHQAAGEYKAAMRMLREVNPLLKKYSLMQSYLQLRIILGYADIPTEAQRVPSLHLTYLLYHAKQSMKTQDFHRALRYARAQKLYGLFIRLAPFFPEPVIRQLKKGKHPGLPRAFVEMPVFQIETPVYHVAFLGKLKISKRGRVLRQTDLSPKDAAFLIHLAVNRERKILLDELYRNFWPMSKEASRNLSHLLVRLRKKLTLPAHLIKMRAGYLRWNIYFTTDNDLYKETIAQAKMLEQAGEWEYARRGYLRAFRLFRDAPFKGMYDSWSENWRRVILYKLEVDALAFKELCYKHKCRKDTAYVMYKVRKLIPSVKI